MPNNKLTYLFCILISVVFPLSKKQHKKRYKNSGGFQHLIKEFTSSITAKLCYCGVGARTEIFFLYYLVLIHAAFTPLLAGYQVPAPKN